MPHYTFDKSLTEAQLLDELTYRETLGAPVKSIAAGPTGTDVTTGLDEPPANALVLEVVAAGAAPDKAGFVLVCSGNAWLAGVSTAVALYRPA